MSTEQLTLINSEDVSLYVNDEWVKANDKSQFEVYNPSTKELVAKVPRAGADETRVAIEGAAEAFKTWSKFTAEKRASYMLRLRDLMLEHTEELARIMSMEMGKAYTEAKGEVTYA